MRCTIATEHTHTHIVYTFMELNHGAPEPTIGPKPTAFKPPLRFLNRSRGRRPNRSQINRSLILIQVKREVIWRGGRGRVGLDRGQGDFVAKHGVRLGIDRRRRRVAGGRCGGGGGGERA